MLESACLGRRLVSPPSLPLSLPPALPPIKFISVSVSASDPVSGPQVLYMRILALQYTNTPVLNTVTNDSTHSYLREFLARGQSPSENLF